MFNWKRGSLKRQSFLLYITIQAAIFLFLFLYFSNSLTHFHYEHLERELFHQSQLITGNPLLRRYIRDSDKLDSWIKELGESIQIRITLVDLQGHILADSLSQPEQMDNHAERPEIQGILMGKERDREMRSSKTLGLKMFYLATPIIEEGEIIGVLRLARSLHELRAAQYVMRKNYIVIFGLTFLLILFITWRYSSSITKPLENITEAFERMAQGNLKERITIYSRENELRQLAQTFNFMAEELENTFKEISHEKGHFEAILTSMVDGVIATDLKQEITLINPVALKMAGLNERDMKGKSLLEVFRNYRLYHRLEEVMKENTTASEEIFFPTPEPRHIRCHFAPVTLHQKEVIGGVILITDITELRHLEQVRKEFVANVSHELKTPLTSIIGYLDTLIDFDTENEETRRHFLGIIKAEADRLTLLIKDLLDLSRIEREPERYYHLNPHQLLELMEKVYTIFKERALEKNIDLTLEKEDIPPVLMIPEEIEQVLINLVDNAIKYTTRGEIVLRSYLDNKRVVVEVQDSGIGIPLEDQERIFERFYRVDKARSRSMGGTGIGLAIVKHILLGHTSEIEVESSPGKGSLFRFYLHPEKRYS